MNRFEDSLLSGARTASRLCRYQLRTAARVLFALLLPLLPVRAFAEAKAKPALPPAVLLATAGAQSAGGGGLDSVIQGALEELQVVNIVSRPGMDLGAVQLAIDCVAETPRCLRAVTRQQNADVLIAPSLARTSGEVVLSILRFDARSTGQMKRVLRRQAGPTLSSATLDMVPAMMRELFELPAKEIPPPVSAIKAPGSGEQPGPLPEAPMEPPSESRSVPVGPIVLAVGGALMMGASAVVGLTVNSARDDFDHQTMKQNNTRSDIDAAYATMDSAKRRAVIADVLVGVGGATLLAAGIWLAVELASKPDRRYDTEARLEPVLGPHQLGLVWTQHGAGL